MTHKPGWCVARARLEISPTIPAAALHAQSEVSLLLTGQIFVITKFKINVMV